MEQILILIIAIFILLWAFDKSWLNKEIWIKRINPNTLSKTGDLTFQNNRIIVRFRWSIKTFTLSDIEAVYAFGIPDWKLEEQEQVEFKFRREKIFFNASIQAHRNFVEEILSEMGIKHEFYWGWLPGKGDHIKQHIVYTKNGYR